MAQVYISPLCNTRSNDCNITVEHPTLRVSDVVRVISLCDRLRSVWPDPMQQVVLERGVLVPHHEVVILPLLQKYMMLATLNVQRVSVSDWRPGVVVPHSAEMERCLIAFIIVIMYSIQCCLPVSMVSPFFHPGVHTHTLQLLLQHLRQVVEEGRY